MTITEESEEELEQLKFNDDEEQRKCCLLENNSTSIDILYNHNERMHINENDQQINTIESENLNNLSLIEMSKYKNFLSTISESSSLQEEIEQNNIDHNLSDKLIVYDIANMNTLKNVIK